MAERRHGTLAKYVQDRCRCDDCRTAAVRYNKRLRYDRANGRRRTVDASRAHAHLDALAAAGMTEWQITRAGGWKSRNAVASVRESRRIRPETERRVLSITPDGGLSDQSYVDATGARRRLQALAVLGWTTRALAFELDMERGAVGDILTGRTARIRHGSAQAIAGCYGRLWNVAGPSERTRTWARQQGFLPPLAWDDDALDDPGAAADPGAVRGGWEALNPDDVRELLEAGLPTEMVAARLGVSVKEIRVLSVERDPDNVRVDALPARNKVRAWQSSGHTLVQIAEASGLTLSQVRAVIDGPRARAHVVARIMGATLSGGADLPEGRMGQAS